MVGSLGLSLKFSLLCLLSSLATSVMTSPVSIDDTTSSIQKRNVWNSGSYAHMGDRIVVGGWYEPLFTDWPFVDKINGAIARRLEIWSSDDNVQGFRLYYADGSNAFQGQLSGSTYGALDLDPGETVASLEIWQTSVDIKDGGSGHNNCKVKVARIRIETSIGKILDVGCKDSSGYASYNINVYSGILIGALGRVVGDLRSFGLIFLQSPIQSLEIVNMTYPPGIVGSQQGITDRSLSELRQVRREDDPDSYYWSLSGSIQVTDSHELSSSTVNSFGLKESVGISGGFLGLGATSTTDFSWSIALTKGESGTNTLAHTETWSRSGTLQPGEGVHVTASILVGKISVPYTATMVMTLEDGTVIKYVDKGTWDSAEYSSVFVSWEIYNATGADAPDLSS